MTNNTPEKTTEPQATSLPDSESNKIEARTSDQRTADQRIAQHHVAAEQKFDSNTYELLLQQVQDIQAELVKLNNHKLVHTYNSMPRLLWFSLLKGVALGLGSVLGATVVLSTLVYLLSQMEFIPIIGEWIAAILDVVQETPEN